MKWLFLGKDKHCFFNVKSSSKQRNFFVVMAIATILMVKLAWRLQLNLQKKWLYIFVIRREQNHKVV